jgi:hypothetical protein
MMKPLPIFITASLVSLQSIRSGAQISDYKPVDSSKASSVQTIANNPTVLAGQTPPPVATPNSIALPTLNLEVKQDEVFLNWVTISENKIDHFSILYSSDGTNWREIATVKAIGNLESGMTYRWSHSNPLIGTNYYQLQIVNKKGAAVYSDIAKVNVKEIASNDSVIIYPNPSYDGIVKVTGASLKGIIILNSTGIDVTPQTEINTYSDNGGQIDMSQLNPGVYYIQINGKVRSVVKN